MKTFYDLKPGDKVRARVDFFNDFSYGTVQRLTAGKEYEVIELKEIDDFDGKTLMLNIVCDAGHSCYWTDPQEQFEVVQ